MMNTPSQLPKPSPASTASLTLPDIEAGITARTIDEAIAAPTFAHAVKSIGRPQMAIVIGKAITRGMGYFAEHQRLSTEAVVLWADLLLDEYPHESLADLSVFLRGAALGRYGQEQRDGKITQKGETFGALSIVKLNTWFGQYLGEKSEAREREARAEKGRYAEACRELHPAVADAIKPVVAKVCAEQHAKRDAAMLEARLKNLTRHLPVMTDQDLRDHYKLVTTDAEKDAIEDEARRRGLMKQPGQSAETKHMIKVGDKVKVQGSNTRHCCYGMVGVISYIRKSGGGYGPSACVVFDERKDEFGDARDYHWCDPDSLVHTDEPCTVMEDPLDRIRGLLRQPAEQPAETPTAQ